jgi:hypothetical protein
MGVSQGVKRHICQPKPHSLASARRRADRATTKTTKIAATLKTQRTFNRGSLSPAPAGLFFAGAI